ncbi:hypothetical protein F5X97DRAFT_138729 [Nemania serpens]|nr:hypothetical protein F5X97DRAFT_138729 [Nemania serpens]
MCTKESDSSSTPALLDSDALVVSFTPRYPICLSLGGLGIVFALFVASPSLSAALRDGPGIERWTRDETLTQADSTQVARAPASSSYCHVCDIRTKYEVHARYMISTVRSLCGDLLFVNLRLSPKRCTSYPASVSIGRTVDNAHFSPSFLANYRGFWTTRDNLVLVPTRP